SLVIPMTSVGKKEISHSLRFAQVIRNDRRCGCLGGKKGGAKRRPFYPFSLLAGVTSIADVERSGTSKGEVSFFYHNLYSKVNRKCTVI
ncbi:MAG TPA: hypothetical protein PK915_12245, partial [Bacteroidales bacterium]|nr:hypothetical protein [Bacteroidales bacterium]